MQALMFLDAGGRADRNRLLDLRAASDLVEPPAGPSLIERLAAKAAGTPETAYQEALETAYVDDPVAGKTLWPIGITTATLPPSRARRNPGFPCLPLGRRMCRILRLLRPISGCSRRISTRRGRCSAWR